MKNIHGVLKKSDRAITAESRGLVTYSKLNAWQKRAVDAGAVTPKEWHHTGAAARRTDYYSPADFDALDPAAFPPRKIEKTAQPDLDRIKIRIVWKRAVSGFSRGARMKFETVEAFGIPDVRKKDRLITGVGGRRLDSANEAVEVWILPPRCRKWRRVSFDDAEAMGYRFTGRDNGRAN